MRLLVYPHDLCIGGSQINAIDLAAGAQAAGHDVIVYGVPGPLTGYIAERGLRFIPASPMSCRPAPTRIAQLAGIAARERIDLIHAYEWPTCLDAYYGASLFLGTPLLCTVLSMSVSPLVPRSVPLIMGTEDLGREARRTQRSDVWVIEPPIDVERDNPDHPEIDGRAFRNTHGLTDQDFVIASVCRLALDLKLDSLVRAIDAVDLLGRDYPVKLMLVGGGPAREALEQRAKAVNSRLGREAIILCGEMLDPRSAYAAADLVVAMGSSALRALSIGRPLIVQGEQAFSEVFSPETLDIFLNQGFYGMADSAPGAGRLAAQIEGLIVDGDRRARLAQYGRKIVTERFSLERALGLQLEIYDKVLAKRQRRNVGDAVRSARLSLMIEAANHNPSRKRAKQTQALRLLSAARSGIWPPVANT